MDNNEEEFLTCARYGLMLAEQMGDDFIRACPSDRCLRSVPLGLRPPNSALGRGPRKNHPALEKGRRPAAFFFCRQPLSALFLTVGFAAPALYLPPCPR